MSAKLELLYLLNMNKVDILSMACRVMENHGIVYNYYEPGEYTWWLDGPIWEFGKSYTYIEPTIGNKDKLYHIIQKCEQVYSPNIKLNSYLFEKIVTIHVSIIEKETQWIELAIYFDIENLHNLNSISRYSKENLFVKRLFYDIAQQLQPCYAVCGIEMLGLVDSPDKVIIAEKNLGIYNYYNKKYFSDKSVCEISNRFSILYDDKDIKIIMNSIID